MPELTPGVAADIREIRATVLSMSNQIERMAKQVGAINGYVRQHSTDLAAARQWREDHSKTHDKLEDDMDDMEKKVWAIGGFDGILAFIGTILHWLRP